MVHVKERKIIAVCLLGSVAGIIALYLVSSLLVPETLAPGDITNSDAGRRVTVSGEVDELRFHENGHIFFELEDTTGSVSVVIWDDKAEQLRMNGVDFSQFRNGASVELTGDVELYKGRPQLVI